MRCIRRLSGQQPASSASEAYGFRAFEPWIQTTRICAYGRAGPRHIHITRVGGCAWGSDASLAYTPLFMCPSHGTKLCACSCRAFSISHSSSRSAAYTGPSGVLQTSEPHALRGDSRKEYDGIHLDSMRLDLVTRSAGRAENLRRSASIVVEAEAARSWRRDRPTPQNPCHRCTQEPQSGVEGSTLGIVQVPRRHRVSRCLVCAKFGRDLSAPRDVSGIIAPEVSDSCDEQRRRVPARAFRGRMTGTGAVGGEVSRTLVLARMSHCGRATNIA